MREQCVRFQDIVLGINQKIFDSLVASSVQNLVSEASSLKNQFSQMSNSNNEKKQTHNRQLRPNLFNPACKQEFDELVAKENKRSLEFVKSFDSFKEQFYDK